ncbi:POTRA domain-containing protein [Brytella acorum]|uniref:POTRA domain-containing protein n=1 Tax=Brytella acorum TaxID=2959299 RepID=A0AA35Y2R1_9PROT|nr:POTRA domain-containing protein [Brytella acorum]MDF3623790.1 POTRA domain-containing protein [Brytella acorum]CAI9121818.1 hypothetical protein LMG32879_002672 [Brytella acorum]
MRVFSRLSRTVALSLAVAAVGLPAVTGLSLAPSAHAAAGPGDNTPLTLKILKITGNQKVSTDEIMAVLPFHLNDTVTRAQINDGIQKIIELYRTKNVGARFGEKERFAGKAVHLFITIEEQAATAAPTQQPFVLDKVNFTGNTTISAADLEAATTLRPGAQVSTEAVTADEKAIQALYAKKNIPVMIEPAAEQPNHDNHVVLTYKITEKAAAK